MGQNPQGKDGCEEEERENGHLRLPAHHGDVVPAELHTPGEHGHLGPPTSRGAVFRASTKTLQAPQETLQLPHVHFRAGTFPLVRSEVQLNYATFPDLTKCLDPRRQLQVVAGKWGVWIQPRLWVTVVVSGFQGCQAHRKRYFLPKAFAVSADKAEVEGVGLCAAVQLRGGLECTFTCSKLEKPLTELGGRSRICKCQYCHFLPSLPKTRLRNPSVSASDGLLPFIKVVNQTNCEVCDSPGGSPYHKICK